MKPSEPKSSVHKDMTTCAAYKPGKLLQWSG